MSRITKKQLITDIRNGMYKFKFYTKYSNRGTNRIFLNDEPTSFYASGSGYDLESAVLAELINEVVGKRDYKNAYTGGTNGKRTISNGIGVSSVINAFNVIGGKLEHLYSIPNIDVYEIDFSKIKGIINE